MFTIKTATGKEFSSVYSTSLANPPVAFLRIVKSDLQTVQEVFSDENELPLDIYPQFHTVDSITDENTAIKIILKP